MKHLTLIIAVLLSSFLSLEAQDDKKQLAREKAMKAIELMDKGEFDESIKLLKEGQKLDKKNFLYPYEIALAYSMQKEYKKSIKVLNKILDYDGITNQVFQLLGNSYSLSGDPEKAIETYQKGLEQFPNSGNLYLETGNVYLAQEKYNLAIQNYEKGVTVDPKYPSNYYRLAKLLLFSNDKVSGLIYGEIFMNLERTTQRTQDMSHLLFYTYQNSMSLSKDSSSIDFCDIMIDASSIVDGEVKLPFCAIFGQNLIMSIIGQEEVNLTTLSEIRSKFIEFYFPKDAEKYPNVLYSYHKKMKEEGVFDAYNHYLFQIKNEEAFNKWLSENEAAYKKFVNWYTKDANNLLIDKDNFFIRN